MIEKYYMIEFWAEKLLLIIKELKSALAEKNLHTLNELNQEIIDYQIQIYCPEDPVNERTLKTLSNKIAVIVYNYEAVVAYDEINSIQEAIKSINFFKKNRRVTQKKTN